MSSYGPLLFRTVDYLSKILHLRLLPEDRDASFLPLGLAAGYDVATCNILNTRCLLLLEKSESNNTPTRISADVEKVQNMTDDLVIFVSDAMSAYWREQLITKGVAFVQAGHQCFIPQLAIDLREHFRKRLGRARDDKFSPIAQLVLFTLLLKGDSLFSEHPTPSHLASILNYSAMSIGRAYQELAAHRLCEVLSEGREKKLYLAGSKRDVLQRAEPFLTSPIRQRLFLSEYRELYPTLQISGESALSEYTMLSHPRCPTRAIPYARWKRGRAREFWEMTSSEDDAVAIAEVWYYNPELLSGGPTVDMLSLFAQFHDDDDPRLQGAAHDLLEQLPW